MTGRLAVRFPELLIALALACGPAGFDANEQPAAATSNGVKTTSAALVAEGLRVYREQFCGTCHELSLAGAAGVFGPSHDGFRAIAEQRIREAGYAGAATTAEEYTRESLVEPDAYRVPGFERTRFLMPAYGQLSGSEMAALIEMLLSEPATEGREQ